MAGGRAALLIVVATGVVVTLLLAFGFAGALELPLRDRALRLLPPRPAEATIVVAIDERSLREIGPWPWPRAELAKIVDRAADAGAHAAILDILLSDPRPDDEVLARAMRRVSTLAVSVLIERDQWLVPAPAIQSATTVAHGNFELDHDGILRRFASTKQNDRRSFTALSIEAASLVAATPVPVGRSVAPAFRTSPRSIPQLSAVDVLRNPSSAQALRDKLVFVGPTALGLGDRVLTPVSAALAPDPGVTVHAAATESLIRGEEIRELPPILSGALAALAVGTVLRTRRRSRAARLGALVALTAAVVFGGFGLIAISGIAVPFGTLMLSTLIATLGVEASLMATTVSQLETGLEEIATRLAEQRAQEVESKQMLAHELKTPLASMRGLTQLLGGFDLTAAERQRVAVLLEAETGKLQTMVSALLDLERLPLRDFLASSSVTDLGELVRARVEFIRASADRPLIASVPSGVWVRADAMLIERVIDNLVGNALKYAPPPSPVYVTVRRSAGGASLEVEDRGPGIAAAERDRVFRRFFRGSSAAGTEGLGLGLSLVAEVARWHGGSVALERSPEGGTLFRITLPLAAGAQAGAM